MPAPLLGLVGRKRTGKDTVANVLVTEYGFLRVAFADPLKRAALSLDPVVGPCALPGHPTPAMHDLTDVVSALGWEKAKDFVPGVRRTLQNLGWAVRSLDETFWVRAGLRVAQDLRDDGFPVVVTDVRFPNEADAIKDAGGALVRITRPGVNDGDTHPSETALDDYEIADVILNDGTLDDLYAQARSLAEGVPVH